MAERQSETAQERYGRLARELGGYFHPWQRTLSGPDPELTFDLLLSDLLTPQTRVLEAGCRHGPDARFLYVGPRLHVPQVPERLQAVGWEVLGEWRASVLAHAPTWADWQTRCEWMEEEAKRLGRAGRRTGDALPRGAVRNTGA